jgi:hypothetical protein
MATPWTGQQVRRLRELFPAAPWLELIEELTPHGERSIRSQAYRLGLRRQRKPKPEPTSKQRDWMAICRAHRPVFVLTGEVV